MANHRSKLANELTQGVRDISQDIGDLAADGAHGRNCRDGDQRRDQCVFDRRCATVVLN